MRRVQLSLLVWIIVGLLFSTSARADDMSGQWPNLTASQVWVRAVPASVVDSAAFARLENTGDTDIVVTGGSSLIAGSAMLMQTTAKEINGVKVLGMAPLNSITIPPHGYVLLKPGGDHLMLMKLKSHPHPGEVVLVSFDFTTGSNGKPRTLTVAMPTKIDAAE